MQPYACTEVRPRLLAVLAHPDDESFGMGGTLAWYAECGAVVSLVCATRGEAGDVDEQYMEGFGSIAARREAELRCAADMLGLSEVHLLNYRDSGMPGTPENTHPQALAAAPLEEVTAKVTHYIRTLRPHVVLTFDPIGGYRHPDHIAIQQATERAFYAASDPHYCAVEAPPHRPHKLYFHTFPRGLLRMLVRLMPLFGKDPSKFGRNQDIDLKSLAGVEFPTHAVIDFLPVEERKNKAGQCHASQGGGSGLIRDAFDWAFRLLGYSGRDTFMRAYPPPMQGTLEHDLFDGIPIEA